MFAYESEAGAFEEKPGTNPQQECNICRFACNFVSLSELPAGTRV
jgi:hypothetical protein